MQRPAARPNVKTYLRQDEALDRLSGLGPGLAEASAEKESSRQPAQLEVAESDLTPVPLRHRLRDTRLDNNQWGNGNSLHVGAGRKSVRG